MTKLNKIELTKVYYYDNERFNRNIEISTISRNISNRNFHNNNHSRIIKKNIFGHRWVLKINDNKNYNKNKCNFKVILYVLVFISLIIAVSFGIYFSFEKIFSKSPNTKNDLRIYPNKWNNTNIVNVILNNYLNSTNLNQTIPEKKENVIKKDQLYDKYKKINKTELNYCEYCIKETEVCLKNDTKISCVKIKDVNDPTGCGGLCKINTQHCKILDQISKLYECNENRNILKCPEDDFNCGNMCVNKKKRCDGVINCSNKLDELNCPCDLLSHFQCGNKTSCIENSRKCDGIVDCWDKSDEVNCEMKCQIDEIMCKNEQCIKKDHFCDGIFHCLDKSDEPLSCQK